MQFQATYLSGGTQHMQEQYDFNQICTSVKVYNIYSLRCFQSLTLLNAQYQ